MDLLLNVMIYVNNVRKDYYFVKGKSNCYNKVTLNYYLDQHEQTFKKCTQFECDFETV